MIHADSKSGPSVEAKPMRRKVPHGKDAKVVHRAGVKGQDSGNRKPVFRPVLSSPLAADWPLVNPADASAILQTFVDLIRIPTIMQQFQRVNDNVPRNSAKKTKEKIERRKTRLLAAVLNEHGVRIRESSTSELGRSNSGSIKDDKTGSDHASVLCGINAVTRSLEGAISQSMRSSTDDTISHRSTFILACVADLSPSSLVAHLPLLVATCNATCGRDIRLIRLPPGSEETLSDAVCLRRCSIVSCDLNALQRANDTSVTKAISSFEQLFETCNIQPFRMPWLESAARTVQQRRVSDETEEGRMHLIEPHIKHLRSSKPNDMNARKAARKDLRKKRKASRSLWKAAERRSRRMV